MTESTGPHRDRPLHRQLGEAHPPFVEEEPGYRRGLKNRQIQMIAMGGAIGTGLFMGAGGRLHAAGPSLVLSYAVCGFFGFLVLRAMGELILHRPSSGSFVSYAREFYGEKAAFTAGWLYWLNWAMTSIVDVTAAALFMNFFKNYWRPIAEVPQWVWALTALIVVLALNLLSVRVFGELEFWFALIKVGALVTFLIVGTCFVIFGTTIDGHEVGFNLIGDNGGLIPNGVLPAIVIVQGVVFAYAGIELIGTTSGEASEPKKIIPKAINAVILRIAVFYVGSILLLTLLLPYTAYQAGISPFVTFFGTVGVGGVDAIMNLVVLTATLSSLNAGLYSTGRILNSLAANGSAPRFAGRMNAAGVPYGGIAITAVVTLLGVGLNAVVPTMAFEIVLNVATLGILACWATILLCHIRLVKWSRQGIVERPTFRLFGAPYTSYLSIAFLAGVLMLIGFDYPIGTYTVSALTVIIPALTVGWFLCRDRVAAIAEQRREFSGEFPVIAARPLVESRRSAQDSD